MPKYKVGDEIIILECFHKRLIVNKVYTIKEFHFNHPCVVAEDGELAVFHYENGTKFMHTKFMHYKEYIFNKEMHEIINS